MNCFSGGIGEKYDITVSAVNTPGCNNNTKKTAIGINVVSIYKKNYNNKRTIPFITARYWNSRFASKNKNSNRLCAKNEIKHIQKKHFFQKGAL